MSMESKATPFEVESDIAGLELVPQKKKEARPLLPESKENLRNLESSKLRPTEDETPGEKVVVEDMIGLPEDDLCDPPLIAQIVTCLVVSVLISSLIHKCAAEFPSVVAANVFLEESFFFRVIGSYICTSLTGQSLMPLVNRRFLASRVSCLEDQQNFRESRSVTAIVVGSVLAGVGAGLAFSFPETVLLQLPFSPMTAGCSISGILLGVMMFSLLENKVESFREFLITDRDTGSAFLDQRYGLDYTRMTLMTGLSSILSLRLFHLLTEYENTEDHQRANPYRIGITLAILQFFLRCYCRSVFDLMGAIKTLIGRLFAPSQSESTGRDGDEERVQLSESLNKDKERTETKSCPTDIQLVGMLAFTLLLWIIKALSDSGVHDQYDYQHINESETRLLFAFFGSFTQAFGSIMTGSGYVRHLSGMTELRVASLIMIPISTAVIGVTARLSKVILEQYGLK